MRLKNCQSDYINAVQSLFYSDSLYTKSNTVVVEEYLLFYGSDDDSFKSSSSTW